MKMLKRSTLLIASLVISVPAFAQSGAAATKQAGEGMNHSSMGHGEMKNGDMKQQSVQASKMAFDQQFLDTMSMHHSHGIQMMELVQERTTHDELKQMAKKMHDEQQQDIKQMQAMKEKWYDKKGDAMNMQMPGMKESMKSHDKNMEKLKSAKGEQFDAMFLDMMSKHHSDGIKMTNTALKSAEHQEVKDMAKKIADSQKKEIAEMADKKKEWKLAGKKS